MGCGVNCLYVNAALSAVAFEDCAANMYHFAVEWYWLVGAVVPAHTTVTFPASPATIQFNRLFLRMGGFMTWGVDQVFPPSVEWLIFNTHGPDGVPDASVSDSGQDT